MKIKISLLAFLTFVSLFVNGRALFANPTITLSSEKAICISNARVIRAPGGGSYVTGTLQTSLGYGPPRETHLHVSAYDATGRLLSKKVDKINGDSLVRGRLNQFPRAYYVVFFASELAQIAKVTVVEHSGHIHPAP